MRCVRSTTLQPTDDRGPSCTGRPGSEGALVIGEPELAQTPIQSRPADAQQACGLGLVTVGGREGPDDGLPLRCLDQGEMTSRRGLLQVQREMPAVNDRGVHVAHQGGQSVGELRDVAGSAVANW